MAAIESPLDADNAGQLSPDGRSALLTFQITGDPDTAQDRVDPALAATAAVQRAHPELLIGEVGDASANKAMSDRIADDFQRAEVTSLPVTLVILVLAFGALVAAGIPLLLGLTAVMAALGLTALFSHLLHVDESINSVILLIGLAVGIDYSLFYLRRYREERARGRSPAEALEIAAATSGRAVLVSGLTVMTAMAGMFLMGTRVFQGFGVGTILVVAIALVGSLTVLPGDHLEARRPHRPRPHPVPEAAGRSATASRASGPRSSAACCAARCCGAGSPRRSWSLLAIPAFRLHTAEAGAQGLPRDLPVMEVYDRAQKAFPGGPLPAIVAVSAPDVTAPAGRRRGSTALKRAALATGQMREPISVDVSASRRAARVQIPLAGEGTDEASNRALDTLRGTVIPSTIGRVDGAEAHVTGLTASSRDFNDSMKSHAPIVFAFVLGLAFLLLLVTFRSIVIPLKAIVLNLLSVGRGLRRARARVPGRAARVAARLPVDRRRDGLAAAVPVRRPLRALDGLPRADPQPRARGLRRRHADRARRRLRHPRHGERRHERGDRDGRRLRDLRDARAGRLQDDGRRPGRRRAPRRDDRARRPAARPR